MRRVMASMAVVVLMAASPAIAQEWGAWHDVTLPNGHNDRVRVKHLAHGTRCDFERADRLDVKLVSIGVPYRACVPSGEEHGD